ncbi:hypothetical protein D3C76_1732080 [compost metagenome]
MTFRYKVNPNSQRYTIALLTLKFPALATRETPFVSIPLDFNRSDIEMTRLTLMLIITLKINQKHDIKNALRTHILISVQKSDLACGL